MPSPTTAKWPKPRSEDEFEDMCIDALQIRWKDPHATRNGRRGQRQHGVDIVGHPPWLKGKTAGAQCKNTDVLTLDEIKAEVTKAETFKGGLGEFLIITSGDRDATLQSETREHFRAHPASFPVELLFWADVTSELAEDSDLVAKHWKGFGGAERRKDGWPHAPAWSDRDQVRDDEIVECHCELALLTPSFSDVSASELAAQVQSVCRESGTGADVRIHSMMNRAPIREKGLFRWQDQERECDNVVRKWTLEIGDDGYLAFRWSRFTNLRNHRESMLEMLPLLDGVFAPLRLHRLAIERATGNARSALPEKLAVRLACHATPSPLLLRDDIKATLPFPTSSMPKAEPDWVATLDTRWEHSSRGIAIRILDRALSNFTVFPGPAGLGGPATFVRLNEDIVSRVAGASL